MPYGLIVNGTLTGLHNDVECKIANLVTSFKFRFLLLPGLYIIFVLFVDLLSPQDLMAVDYVPELIAAGVSSFKIEGRLKGPEYVAMTTRAYREAIDEVWSQLSSTHPVEEEILQAPFTGPSASMRRDLAQVFSRGQDESYDGLSAGFLAGVRHQDLVRGNSPRHRGLLVGKVIGVTSKGVNVNLLGPVKRGDGVVFDQGKPEEKEEGGSVYEVIVKGKSSERGEEISSGQALLTFGHGALDVNRIHLNDLVWRNKDPVLDQRLKEMVDKTSDCSQLVPVEVSVAGRLGQPLTISIQVRSKDDANDVSVVYASTTSNLAVSTNKPLTAEEVSKAIGQLGGTPFFVSEDVDASGLESGLFVPASEIKAARREAVENLIALRRAHNRDAEFNNSPDLLTSLIENSARTASTTILSAPLTTSSSEKLVSVPQVSILCRTPAQVTAACAIEWLDEIILDFLEVHGIRDAVRQVQAAGKTAVVATPRVIKPDEERLVFFYLRLKV